MLHSTHGLGDPGFTGKGKRFANDIIDRTSCSGFISEDSNASELELSSSDEENLQTKKKSAEPKTSVNSAMKLH